MPNNVVHFAIHADDVERARRFYEAVFGWRFEAWGTYDSVEIPTVGTLTQFLDTEGNELAAMVYEREMFGS